MTKKGVNFQLAPPNCHRRNAAEGAICTFKNHFIAGMATTDKQYLIHLCDRLLPQAVKTLNLLQQSWINPRLSAEAQLNGAFDYNQTPMAPPGTCVIVHKKPAKRGTWAPHRTRGWYMGTAQEHYRCYKVHITKTASEQISDTVEFFPQQCDMP